MGQRGAYLCQKTAMNFVSKVFFFTKRIRTHSTNLHSIQIIGLFTLYMDFRIGKKSFLGKIYLNASTPANYLLINSVDVIYS